MGIYDLLSDIAASLGVSSVDADAPPKDDEKGEDGGEEVKGEGEEKEEPEEQPEEEEEEEPEDLKPKLEEGEWSLVLWAWSLWEVVLEKLGANQPL
jgi:ubiquinol-cytochrome c reductase subunit 6